MARLFRNVETAQPLHIIRFRTTPTLLQASIVESFRVVRVHDTVRQRHLASLGSIAHDPSPHDRIAFWQRVNAKLNALSNRIDAETQARLRGEIHAVIPMPSTDDQREVQRANAEADAQIWSALHDMNAADAAGYRAMASKAAKLAADSEERANEAQQKATAASDRLARLHRGEEVSGGLGKPATFDAAARAAGLTAADLRRMSRICEIARIRDGAVAAFAASQQARRPRHDQRGVARNRKTAIPSKRMTRRRDDRQIGKFFRIGKKASPWAMPGALTIAAMPIACEAETAMKISRRDSAVDPAILFDPRSGTTTMGRPLGTAISRYAAGE